MKAETKAAAKAGELTPAGQGSARSSAAAAGPATTRAERKAATLEARKSGTLVPAGPRQPADLVTPTGRSTKTRAERKAETAEAARKRQLAPAGPGGE